MAYSLGNVDKIPVGEGRLFHVKGSLIAVFRTRHDEVFGTQPYCPHGGGPLFDGIVGGGQLVCPLHSYRFELATGAPVGNECAALKTYQISLSETGEILVMPNADGIVEDEI